MPGWNSIQQEIQSSGTPYEHVRRAYLKTLAQKTGRNVIAYYSAFLQSQTNQVVSIMDADKEGFMNAIQGMDKSKGLALLLHTPRRRCSRNGIYWPLPTSDFRDEY